MTKGSGVKKFVFMVALIALLMLDTVLAKTEDESNVILPLEAQTCNLPVAPARVTADADYDALVKAKANINDFQARMISYRECLELAEEMAMLTDGNRLALQNAHNYSVEMEERMAEQFNVAVRAYKARQAANKE